MAGADGSVVNTVESTTGIDVVLALVVGIEVVVVVVVFAVSAVVVVVEAITVVVVGLVVVVAGIVVVTRDVEVVVVGAVSEVVVATSGTGGVPHWTVTADHADTAHHRTGVIEILFFQLHIELILQQTRQ